MGSIYNPGSPGGSEVKNPPAMQEMQVWSLGQEDPLEKEMATHSSILAWRIPWTEEPGGLQSVGLQRVGHNLETKPPPHLWPSLEEHSFPGGSDGKESACNVGDPGQEEPVKKGLATHAIFLPGEFHGQRSLVGHSPSSCKELDMNTWLSD